MADNFDDKNLFGDSFDFLQSDSGNLFGDNKQQNKTTNLQTNKQTTTNNINFGFEENLFGGGLDNNLFGDNNLNKNTNTQSASQNKVPTNIDFGFEDNNLFGETSLPKNESKQEVPNNLFDDTSANLFDDAQGQQEDGNNVNLNADQEQELIEENNEINTENSEENLSDENLEKIDSEPENKGNNENNKKIKNKDKKDKKLKEIKDKAEKTEEQKEKDKKRNKLIIIISSIAFVVVLAIILIVVLTNRPGEKMGTPDFNVYQRESGTVLVVDKQEGATGYEVVVSQTGKQDTVFASKDSTIELRLYFNEPGVFNVKVRVLGTSTSTHSDYSVTKQISNYVKLDTPEVFRNGDTISWNKVDGAVKYKLYYRANILDNSVDYIELNATESVTTFDLTTLNEHGAGVYPVCVEAIASGEFLLNSDYSQVINYAYCASLDAPMAVVYDDETYTLTFVTYADRTQAERYLVVASLDSGTVLANHYVYANELATKTITYQGVEAIMYNVNLNELLAGEPVHLTIKAVGDGVYSTDSSIVDALTI